MEEPPSSIIDRRTAIIAFLREALMEGGVSPRELEVKAREAGLLGRLQSISHAKLFKEAKKILAYDRFELVLDSLVSGCGGTGCRRHPPLPPQYSYRKQGLGRRTPIRQPRAASGMPRPPTAGLRPNLVFLGRGLRGSLVSTTTALQPASGCTNGGSFWMTAPVF